jgi:hypothetical protein
LISLKAEAKKNLAREPKQSDHYTVLLSVSVQMNEEIHLNEKPLQIAP